MKELELIGWLVFHWEPILLDRGLNRRGLLTYFTLSARNISKGGKHSCKAGVESTHAKQIWCFTRTSHLDFRFLREIALTWSDTLAKSTFSRGTLSLSSHGLNAGWVATSCRKRNPVSSLSLVVSTVYMMASRSPLTDNEPPICWMFRQTAKLLDFFVLSPATIRIMCEAPKLS